MQLALSLQEEPPKELSHSEQRLRLMRMLVAAYHRGEYITNLDCIEVGLSNFRSRFSEMRENLEPRGWFITHGKFVRKGLYKYNLIRLPEVT
jgi:hypothetical protein